MLIIDGVKYNLRKPADEKQLEEMVKEHAKEIFGKNSVYFDLKQKLTSKAGIVSIPDGYVISLSKPFEWFIVEGELSEHPLHEHITNQLNKFVTGVKNPYTQKELVDALYDEIANDKLLRVYIESTIGSPEIKGFLYDLILKPPKIVVVIEEKGDEVIEACDGLKVEPIVVDFKTYVRENAENVHAHLFEPLYAFEKIPEKGVKEKKEEGKRPLPEHYESWEKMLSWVDENTKDLVKVLTDNIINLGEVTHVPHGRNYCFYRGKPRAKSIFVAFLLTKKALKVRIRTDPKTFKDFRKWTGDRIYRGWFFKQGEEREFKITDKEQIDYAMELIKHSYQISGEETTLESAFR